jgi:hypothetical protein
MVEMLNGSEGFGRFRRVAVRNFACQRDAYAPVTAIRSLPACLRWLSCCKPVWYHPPLAIGVIMRIIVLSEKYADLMPNVDYLERQTVRVKFRKRGLFGFE